MPPTDYRRKLDNNLFLVLKSEKDTVRSHSLVRGVGGDSPFFAAVVATTNTTTTRVIVAVFDLRQSAASNCVHRCTSAC